MTRLRSEKIVFIVCLALLMLALWGLYCEGSPVAPPENLWQGIIGEAVGEGYEGMYAVTCAYKNRLQKGMPLGCVALKRRDLREFVRRQGPRYEVMAKNIVEDVFRRNKPDVTQSATHYENIEAFGVPHWAKHMRVTVKIGSHTFYKELQR